MNFERVIYTLDEIEGLLPGQKNEILKAASCGDAVLYAKVPEDYVVFSVDSKDLDISEKLGYITPRTASPSLPVRLPGLSMMELFKDTCLCLLNNGIATQRTFRVGASITPQSEIKTVIASAPNPVSLYSVSPPSNSLIWFFACYVKDLIFTETNRKLLKFPKELNVSCSNVFVTRHFLLEYFSQRQLSLSDSVKVLRLPDAPYISGKLRSLREVLLQQYQSEKINSDRISFREIENRLCSDFKFTGNQAKGAVAILRFDLEAARNSGSLAAMNMNALIECAILHWEPGLGGSKFEHTTAEMTTWLMEHTPLPEYLAAACVAIIRPETAMKAGRKRKL